MSGPWRGADGNERVHGAITPTSAWCRRDQERCTAVKPCQCCESVLAKERGMALALTGPYDLWKEQFADWVRIQPPGTLLTSEDILEAVGLPTGEVSMNANNAVGSMVNGLSRKGLLVKSGHRVKSRRKSSHAAELVVWKRSNVL